MVELTNKEFFQDLDQTIAAQLFEQTTYPWEILPLIKDFILKIGPTLSKDEYDQVEEDVWIAKSATIAKTATINGPAIIGPDTEVRPGAFIRGNALIGAGCVVGNSTEIKNDILFNNVPIFLFSRQKILPSDAKKFLLKCKYLSLLFVHIRQAPVISYR